MAGILVVWRLERLMIPELTTIVATAEGAQVRPQLQLQVLVKLLACFQRPRRLSESLGGAPSCLGGSL